ncbi:uncharacterized protein BDV14DRAFT_176218 [Aspergillus stella-maris]|uniref:uncharacterized protein n=1 Tax=Aspergillus stella-maris TaxID=1810926 RepID=UPI003CCDD7CD
MASFSKAGAYHGSSLKTALHRSQQAPVILGQQASAESSIRILPLGWESSGDFDSLEKLFFSCLQSADDKGASSCLHRLAQRFGSSNERILGLQSLYDEAIATNQLEVEQCLKTCDDILSQNPVNLPILKRRVAILRSLSRPTDSISGLIQLLEAAPTDAEAWCELAEIYQSQGMSQQAIFSLEEALLVVPHAWNVHSRLGEILYVYANSLDSERARLHLQTSIRHFCRSVELCDGYLRGFYGLVLATSRFLVDHDLATEIEGPDTKKNLSRRLHSLAVKQLRDILQTQYSQEPHLREYDENELAAARKLLDDSYL